MTAVRVPAAVLAFALLGFSAALAVSQHTSATTYGGASTWFVVLELVAGAGVVLAGAMLLSEGATTILGLLALAAAAAWLAQIWVGWDGGPSPARSIGLAAAPLLAVVVILLAASLPPPPRTATVLAAVGGVALLAASIALVLARDPLRDLYCWSDCTVQPLLGGDHVRATRRLTDLVLALDVAVGGAAALVGLLRLRRARRGARPGLAAAALAGLALAAYAAALLLEPAESPRRPLYEWLFVARSLALVALAGAFAWLALRPRLVRSRVTRLAVDLERTAAGGLGDRLARALGDATLRLGYPVGDRVVDADGRPLVLDGSRRITPVVGDRDVTALVESDVLSADALERELGPAAQFALANERLRAEALARLEEVRASRARIVETADAARRRIERDLHDGAQQRMLALTYDLRVALTIAEEAADEAAATPLRAALDRAESASRELRDIAHGIFPAELATSGLTGALDSLADLRPLRLTIELPPGTRYRHDVEAAAYAVVAESAQDGVDLAVALAEKDTALHVSVEGEVDWAARLVRVEDRVGAACGSVHVSGRRLEATFSA